MAEDKKWFNTREINPPNGLSVLICNVEQNRENAPEMTKLIEEKGITNPQVIEGLYYPMQLATHKFIEGKHYFLSLDPEKGGYQSINVTHWCYLPKTPDCIAFNKNN